MNIQDEIKKIFRITSEPGVVGFADHDPKETPYQLEVRKIIEQ